MGCVVEHKGSAKREVLLVDSRLSRREQERYQTNLVLNSPRSELAEAYRTLRSNLQFCNVGKQKKVLLVTSSLPQEGKSTTLANLAISFCQLGKRVIAVDADLREPTIHRVFGISNLVGLTSVLIGHSDLSSSLQATEVPRLSVLPAGPIPPNPAELVSSTEFSEVITALRQKADLVLIDGPPVMPVTDSSLLATHADGVVFVVAAGQAASDIVQRALMQLNTAKANVLGIVFNKAPSRGSPYYYGYSNGER